MRRRKYDLAQIQRLERLEWRWTPREEQVIINYLKERGYPKVSPEMIKEMQVLVNKVSQYQRTVGSIRCHVTTLRNAGKLPSDAPGQGKRDKKQRMKVRPVKIFSYSLDDIINVLVSFGKRQYDLGTLKEPGFCAATYSDIFIALNGNRGTIEELNAFLWKAIEDGHLIVYKKGTPDNPTVWDIRNFWKVESKLEIEVVGDEQMQQYQVKVADNKNDRILEQVHEILSGTVDYLRDLTSDLELNKDAVERVEMLERENTKLRKALADRDATIETLGRQTIEEKNNAQAMQVIGTTKAEILKALSEYEQLPLWRKRDLEPVFINKVREAIQALTNIAG